MVQCVRDPCGWLLVSIVYGAIAYCDYVILYWIAYKLLWGSFWAYFHITAFNLLILCLFASHIRTAVSNPGIVPKPYETGDAYKGVALPPNTPLSESDENSEVQNLRKIQDKCLQWNWTECKKCRMLRPPRSHHCRYCGRCVRKMDHHCPWVNNCVGFNNQKYFLQFLFWVALTCLYAIITTVVYWAKGCAADCSLTEEEAQGKLWHSILVIMLCVLFGVFSITMLIDQISCIMNDRTSVEEAKGEDWVRSKKMGKKEKLQEICGQGVCLLWVLPFNSRKLPEEREFWDFSALFCDSEENPMLMSQRRKLDAVSSELVDAETRKKCQDVSIINSGAVHVSELSYCKDEIRPLATCTSGDEEVDSDFDSK